MADILTSRQVELLEAMLTGKSCTRAAQSLGIAERTARRWVAKPLFRAELRQRTADGLADASRSLAAMMMPATQIIGQLAEDTTVPAAVRLAAARAILGDGLALNEVTMIQDRIAELERLL